MSSSIPFRQFRSLVIPIALAVTASFAAVLLAAPVVSGQESAKDEMLFVGAHEIRVVPVNLNLGAGSAQYSAIVTHPETGEPVPDARVVFLASKEGAGEPGWAIATNSPAAPEQYDVNLKLDSTGQWIVSVDVSSSIGADLVEVTTLEVPSVNRLTQGTWVFVGVFVAIFCGIAYVWWSARRDYLRKRAAQVETS